MRCRYCSLATLMCLLYCSSVLTKTSIEHTLEKVQESKTNVETTTNIDTMVIEAPEVDLKVTDSQLAIKWSHVNNNKNNLTASFLNANNSMQNQKILQTQKIFPTQRNPVNFDDPVSLGLPPEIADEYIDNVNPPRIRLRSANLQFAETSSPVIQSGSLMIPTKVNYSKPRSKLRNLDLAVLLKAELDAKKAELDSKKLLFTPTPNLFALLPSVKAINPFEEGNYKTPDRQRNNIKNSYEQLNHQLMFNGATSTSNSNRITNNLSITTPSSTSFAPNFISTPSHNYNQPKNDYTKNDYKKNDFTKNKHDFQLNHNFNNYIEQMKETSSETTSFPLILTSANRIKNKTNWSLRANNQTTGSFNSNSSVIKELITGLQGDKENQPNEPFIVGNNFYTVQDYDYNINDNGSEKNIGKNDYNDFDYADNIPINTNVTLSDGYSDHPGATYRLTTERLAYILIGSCCALSILCLIVVAMSVRCRDMCDEYRSWKKAEKAAQRWHRHQYRLTAIPPDMSRYFRTSFQPSQEYNRSNLPLTHLPDSHVPLFGPTCCHCLNCSSSWLFRDAKRGVWGCTRGYYHPAPRGKLPFGAASTVNTFMPRHSTANHCDEADDTDSLNASELIDNRHAHNAYKHTYVDNSSNNIHGKRQPNQRHQQLRRIAQPNGNLNWLHSSELVDELHRKHCNVNGQNDQHEQSNINGLHHSRHHRNDNVVVWNNTNDERLI